MIGSVLFFAVALMVWTMTAIVSESMTFILRAFIFSVQWVGPIYTNQFFK